MTVASTLTKEVLEDLYVRQGLSMHIIAEQLGCSKWMVSDRCKRFGISPKPKTTDLTGQVFGRLTVQAYAGQTRRGRRIRHLWRCSCVCGETPTIETWSLKCGAARSCGCWQREVARTQALADLIGQRFHSLVVLRQDTAPRKKGDGYWICRCDCGNICSDTTDRL